MRYVIATLVFAAATLGAPQASAHTSHHAIPRSVALRPAASCTTTGYTKNCTGCITIPGSGRFTIKVPHANASVRGTGSRSTSKTRVCLAKVSKPKPSLGGVGARVTATGKFPALHPAGKNARAYLFTPKTGKVHRVSSIKKAGIYQIVP